VLGKPQQPQGDAHLRACPLLLVQPGKDGFDAFGLAQPQQGLQYACPDRPREGVRCDQAGG
jgi:hypothetical protein